MPTDICEECKNTGFYLGLNVKERCSTCGGMFHGACSDFRTYHRPLTGEEIARVSRRECPCVGQCDLSNELCARTEYWADFAQFAKPSFTVEFPLTAPRACLDCVCMNAH